MENKEIFESVEKNNVKFVNLQFVDILGAAKSVEIPVSGLRDALESGVWFDGSSIEGFVRICESDMFLKPDPSTYSILPWTNSRVARVICDVHVDENTPFEGDPRYVLRRQLAEAEKEGFSFKVGPELEFFLFREKGENGRAEREVHDTAGYFDLGPRDLAADLRREMSPALEAMGITVEASHHEVAPGQHEIDFKYGDALCIADCVLAYKTVVKTVAQKYGLFASFMPKPKFGISGSGMHVHQSLWKGEENAFFSAEGKYNLSETALPFIAGQLAHARALAALTNPTVNSYKRLVPGYEAPVYISWARTNRSALIRVPRYQKGRGKAARAELRCPDPSCNPYLAFAGMLAAGLDGMKKKTEPPAPLEEDLYSMGRRERTERNIQTLPASIAEAVDELGKDEVLKDALGPHVFSKLTEAQLKEWEDYSVRVSEWEVDKYFRIL